MSSQERRVNVNSVARVSNSSLNDYTHNTRNGSSYRQRQDQYAGFRRKRWSSPHTHPHEPAPRSTNGVHSLCDCIKRHQSPIPIPSPISTRTRPAHKACIWKQANELRRDDMRIPPAPRPPHPGTAPAGVARRRQGTRRAAFFGRPTAPSRRRVPTPARAPCRGAVRPVPARAARRGVPRPRWLPSVDAR
jgi:hypothetical protein